MIKKAEISVQTFFFIFMVILMIGIIMFGLQKLVFVNKLISDQELIEIKTDLEKAFEYCENPLNRDSFTTVEINNNNIDGVCVNKLSGNYSTQELISEFIIINETGNNVILFQEFNIIDSFSVDYDEDFCVEKLDNFRIKIKC